MSSSKLQSKQKYFLSHSDCINMTILGYEYFDFLFTRDDWCKISDLPNEGLHFLHNPTAHPIIKMITNSKLTLQEKYDGLIPLRKEYEENMMTLGLLFPNEWDHDIIDYSL